MSGKPTTAIFTVFDEYERTCTEIEPEHSLLLAILENAFQDYQRQIGADARRAKAYFLNTNQEHPFSFLSICEYLDIDPEYLLRKIL